MRNPGGCDGGFRINKDNKNMCYFSGECKGGLPYGDRLLYSPDLTGKNNINNCNGCLKVGECPCDDKLINDHKLLNCQMYGNQQKGETYEKCKQKLGLKK
jgi:hypothetical protein